MPHHSLQAVWHTRCTKWCLALLFPLALFALLATPADCPAAFTRAFGPYMGKVVDLETGEPIEGAAVLMMFHTRLGDESQFGGAMEALTDRNGEFSFSSKRFFTYHLFSYWESEGYVKIFKPGYGCYPDHNDSGPLFIPNGTLPKNTFVIIKLPKLRTPEERKRNIVSLPDIPEKEMKNLIKLKNEERANVGLKP